ncbi:28367_t:CDS:2, partial [Racocetra persica]
PTSKYSYNQPSYTDDVNNVSSNGTVEESTLIQTPDDNTNLFSLFSTSILAVYFMLTGDSSSVSSWGLKNNWALAFFLILSEIELFWMLPYQRRKNSWFPEILYYEVSVNELKKYVKEVEDKENLLPAILEICNIKDSKDELKELKKQISEALNKIDKIDDKLIELMEKKNQ